MNVKTISISLGNDGKTTFFAVGANLITDGKETKIKVSKISINIKDRKCEIFLSDKTKFVYAGYPFSFSV